MPAMINDGSGCSFSLLTTCKKRSPLSLAVRQKKVKGRPRH
jgi:hypothetical protein